MRSRFAGMGFLRIFFVLFYEFLGLANAGILAFYRKELEKREENRQFFAGGLNMETEKKREKK